MKDLMLAQKMLEEKGFSLVIVKEREVIFTSSSKGVLPLLKVLTQDKNALIGAALADKIMGKAAALLALYAQVDAVYARVLSSGAQEILKTKVKLKYQKLVPFIKNLKGDGNCPMEQLCANFISPEETFHALSIKFKEALSKE